jgi:hypothetical protein
MMVLLDLTTDRIVTSRSRAVIDRLARKYRDWGYRVLTRKMRPRGYSGGGGHSTTIK